MANRPPPVALERLARLEAATGARAWSATAGAPALLASVGFELAGEVMGAVAATLTPPAGLAWCGLRDGSPPPIRLGGGMGWQANPANSGVPFPKRLEAAYGTALDRLRDEVRARGADGAIDVRIETRPLAGALNEITVTGLAVRGRCAARPGRPMLTTLGPSRFATLLASGWVPVDIHVAAQVGVRHSAQRSEQVDLINSISELNRANFEMQGFTELVTAVRSSLRTKLTSAAGARGADSVTMSTPVVSSHHTECGAFIASTDRVVTAHAIGESYARFGEDQSPAPTTVVSTGPRP